VTKLNPATVPPAVLEAVKGLQAGGFRAFLVGGCVRDLLRGARPKDFDVASSATPAQVQKLFAKVIPTGIEHGTVTVVLKGTHVEVTTFRAEAEYLDGRRPSKVEFHEDIEADLSRRDFTMNAIAWDPIGNELVDPFDGQGDLARRTVRCVRKAFDRFSEDGLRPLRAVRFATVLDFKLEPETEAAISQTLAVFKKVAQERVHQEFVKLLAAPTVVKGLVLLERTGLLSAFLPEADRATLETVGRGEPNEVLRLALLLLGRTETKAALTRLKFPTKVCDEAHALAQITALPRASATDAELRRFLARHGLERAELACALHLARATPNAAEVAARLRPLIAARPPLTAKDLALDGKAIMAALEVGPSPLVGQATRFLVEQVLDEPTRNRPESLRELLRAWPRPT